MEDLKTAVEGTPDAPAPDPNASPTLTRYQEIANGLIADILKVTAGIPGFENEQGMTRDFVRRKSSVSEAFVLKAFSALQVVPELRAIKQLTGTEAADDTQFIEAFEPVASQAEALLRGVRFAINGRKARRSANAQKIYAFAKGITLEREGGSLGTHVEAMARARKIRRRSAKPVTGAETPGPVAWAA